LIRKSKELNEPGNYVEISGAAFDSFVKRAGVPVINDEEKVRAILKGKDLEWHGDIPIKKVMVGTLEKLAVKLSQKP
jgi:hypothetical protein